MKVPKSLPKRVPEISVVRLPARRLALRIQGHPTWLCKFTYGDRFLWTDYDYPEAKLAQFYDCHTAGPVIVEGRDCIELSCHLYDARGRDGGEALSYFSMQANRATTLLFILKNPDGRGKVEQVEDRLPLTVRTGAIWTSWEEYRSGNLVRKSRYQEIVDGPYRVTIGRRKDQCLRWMGVSPPEEKEQKAYETFLSVKTGLAILFRRYNGSGSKNYDSLRGSLELRHQGRVFRLWYVSLPWR